MCAIVVIYELMIVCVFIMDVRTIPVNNRNNFKSFTTEDTFGFNPTSEYPTFIRNSLKNIDIKELLEQLNNNENSKTLVAVSKDNILIYIIGLL